jgi:hypothetical protein
MAITSADGVAETTVAEWTGCAAGTYGPTVSSSFADTILNFFLDHPKP